MKRLRSTAAVAAAALTAFAALTGAAPAVANDEVIICPDCVIDPGATVPGSAGRAQALIKIEGVREVDASTPKLLKIEGLFHEIELKLGAVLVRTSRTR